MFQNNKVLATFVRVSHQKRTPTECPTHIHDPHVHCPGPYWYCGLITITEPSRMLEFVFKFYASMGHAHNLINLLMHFAPVAEHQSSASLAFVRGIHRWPVNSPHKGPVTRKMFPFDDVIMVIYVRKLNFKSITLYTWVKYFSLMGNSI